MRCTSIKLRPFNIGGAFELVLPNGKVILIDPCFTYYNADGSYTGEFEGGYTRDDVTGADYILLSHSHWDHDINVGYFVEKFNSKVFCSIFSAEAVLKYHNIPYDNLFPVYPNARYTLDDFMLETFQCKHNPMMGRRYEENCGIANKIGVYDHSRCDQLGNMDSLDFLITTNNNFSILMASGQVIWNDLFDVCKEKHPNVLLRQAGVRKDDRQVPAEKLAELLLNYHAQIIIPFHHEVMIRKSGKEWVESYFKDVSDFIRRSDPGAAFIDPIAWKWYDIGIDVAIKPEL